MPSNELYLVVLPLIHITQVIGLTEQVITLLPGREMATVFYKDEVPYYVQTFMNRANQYLTGGHVKSYDVVIEDIEAGRVVVKVTQNVG